MHHPRPPLFLEKKAFHPQACRANAEGGLVGGEGVRISVFCIGSGSVRSRGRENKVKVRRLGIQSQKKYRMKQKERWGVISDSFLLTEAIGYKKPTQWLAGCAKGVI